jgi:hypothetical protein
MFALWNRQLPSGEPIGQTAPALNYSYSNENGPFATGTYITGILLEIWTPYGWPTTDGLLREIYHLGNGVADINGAPQHFPNSSLTFYGWAASPFLGQWSNGEEWGIWVVGEGYDNKYGAYAPIYANVTLDGIEVYPSWEEYVTRTATSNYEW